MHHERSKHIGTHFHYIRECIELGKVDVEHVSTDGQLADILTKSLGRAKFVEMRQALGMKGVRSMQQD